MKGRDHTLSLLLVAFVVLKLTKVIDWPWVWVLAPAWVGLAVALIALLILWATGYYSTQKRLERISREFFRGRR